MSEKLFHGPDAEFNILSPLLQEKIAQCLIEKLGVDSETAAVGLEFGVQWHIDFSERLSLKDMPTKTFIRDSMRAARVSACAKVAPTLPEGMDDVERIMQVAHCVFFFPLQSQRAEYRDILNEPHESN